MNTAAITSAPPVLEGRNLSVVLGGKQVLDVPAVQILQGEVLVIIGPNGSGKTTLLLTLALLQRVTGGAILYRGEYPKHGAEQLRVRRRLAMVFQEPLLLNTTVWENVALGQRFRGVGRNDVRIRTQRWLDRFGISALAGRQARTLSGGEAQRASLARAFALEPEVLFLDEPFAALDSPTRQSLTQDFLGVLRETKLTTVMVTHDRNEALILADRVAVVMKGQLRQVGSPRDVFSEPADEDVAGFVGVENIWHGTVSNQSRGIATVELSHRYIEAVSDLPAGSPAAVCLRPEDVTITIPSAQPEPTSARNHLAGRITGVSPLGSQVSLTVDCGFTVIALITTRSFEDLGLGVGSNVSVSFKASSLHLLSTR